MAEIEMDKVQADIVRLTEKIRNLQTDCEDASNKNDIETLSKSIIRLARVNSYLGRSGRYAEYVARNADRAARRFRADRTLELSRGQAVRKSELQAELESEEMFTIASEAQLLADQATDLAYRTDTFLKMVQSRVSLMKDAIR